MVTSGNVLASCYFHYLFKATQLLSSVTSITSNKTNLLELLTLALGVCLSNRFDILRQSITHLLQL